MALRPHSLVLICILLAAALFLPAAAGEESSSKALVHYREGLEARGTGPRLEALKALMNDRPEGTVDLLGQYIQDPNSRFRRSVLDSLVILGGEEALAHLDRALVDENPLVRTDATRALAAWPGTVSTERLERALGDPEGSVVVAAVEALTERDAAGHLRLLIPLLESRDDYVVRAAALAVRRAGSPEAVPALARAAAVGRPLSAVPATEAIGHIGGPEAVAALSRLAQPGLSSTVRQTAVQGIGQNPSAKATSLLLDLAEGPASGEETGQEERVLRRIAVLALPGQGDHLEGQGARIAALLSDEDPQFRRAVLQTLRSAPLTEAESPVRAIVSDGEREAAERVLALRVLALYDPSGARSLAADFARRGDLNLRLEAMQVLGADGDDAGSRQVLLSLVADPDPSVSALALDYLREGMGPGDVGSVARAATSQDAGVRASVCELLASSGATEAVPTLVSLLDDPEPGVRQAAASGLGRLGGEEAREALGTHRMDPDPGVRSAVKDALRALSP